MNDADANDHPLFWGHAAPGELVAGAPMVSLASGQALLRAVGLARPIDNPRALLVTFNRPPTDDELRALHDCWSAGVAVTLVGNGSGTPLPEIVPGMLVELEADGCPWAAPGAQEP